MTRDEIAEYINILKSHSAPQEGELDHDDCIIEVISRLPENVAEWVIYETNHIFSCPRGSLGESHRLYISPAGEKHEDSELRVIRLISLSETLWSQPRDEALWTIAHELAHSYNNDSSGTADAEEAADMLAAAWGFPTPQHRHAMIAEFRRQEANGSTEL
jgi:hypothetical protein